MKTDIKVGQVWLVRAIPQSGGVMSIKVVAVETDKNGLVKVKGVQRWKHGAWYLSKESNFFEFGLPSLICAVPDVE